MAAIELLCHRFGFKIDDYNYREAQTEMMRAGQAQEVLYHAQQDKREVHRLRNQRVDMLLGGIRIAGSQASDVLPIVMHGPDTMKPQPQGTIYAGPEMLAFALSNIINNIFHPPTPKE
jgi:hypothetical protein